MSKRHRTQVVLKLFPSVPKGVFAGRRITAWLERRLFYREFRFSPWKLAFHAVCALILAAGTVASLGLAWHAVQRNVALHETVSARDQELATAQDALQASRRDYYLLLSRIEPLDAKVSALADFSGKLATVAGLPEMGDELGETEEQRRLELRLTEEEIADLDARFERLGSRLASQELELAHTPSICPLKDQFVPTDRYGYRRNRFTRQGGKQGSGGNDLQFHSGFDLAAPVGTPIHATAHATVHFAGRIPAKQNPRVAYYGNFVVLDHGNGTRTVYAHCDRLNVVAGEEVERGDVIAWVGSTGRSTGPHLHYEVVIDGRPLDPVLFMLDVDIPRRRVQVKIRDDHSLLVDEVEKLLGQSG